MDCELTVDDPTGHSLFGQLLSRARKSEPSSVRHAIAAHPARLYVFDMLATGNRSIRELPLIERKRWLRDSFTDSAALVFVNGVIGAGHQVFALAQTHRFEGMVGKRLSFRHIGEDTRLSGSR
jgi:bifunctional non-homologous end joining protein LigD